MSKKKSLTPEKVLMIIADYRQTLRLVYGDLRADQTEISHRSGWFWVKPPAIGSLGIPYRAHEIEALTAELRKKIKPRADSDDDGDPD